MCRGAHTNQATRSPEEKDFRIPYQAIWIGSLRNLVGPEVKDK
ncbi:8517_t:CDS:1, partial [Paraglomus occultum]